MRPYCKVLPKYESFIKAKALWTVWWGVGSTSEAQHLRGFLIYLVLNSLMYIYKFMFISVFSAFIPLENISSKKVSSVLNQVI